MHKIKLFHTENQCCGSESAWICIDLDALGPDPGAYPKLTKINFNTFVGLFWTYYLLYRIFHGKKKLFDFFETLTSDKDPDLNPDPH